MKSHLIASIVTALIWVTANAEPTTSSQPNNPPNNLSNELAKELQKHRSGARKLAAEQDDLSADVQDLIDEQTDAQVIQLLREVEEIMADATDQLDTANTGGATIAIETQIIEKIFETAKKKQQQNKQSGSGSPQSQQGTSSMLQMMRQMMNGGQDLGEGQEAGEQAGKNSGDQPGQGGNGGGQSNGQNGKPDNTAENNQRRIPRNSGNTKSALPREFHKAMDAYNKGVSKKSNS